MTTATIDTPVSRAPCTRCGGHRRLYSTASHAHDGPMCPRCRGKGVEPTQLGPQRPLVSPDDPSVAHTVAALKHLALRREDWQHARTRDANDRRAEIVADIKAAYWEAYDAGLRIGDIAWLLGISRQQLDKIRKQ